MKAIVFEHYGRPRDVLRLEEIPTPTPRRGEVRVKVHTTAVNDWDWCFVRGKPFAYRPFFGLRRPKVRVLGAEVAGTVDAIGDGVTKLAVGEAVYGDLSEAGFGGFAEYVCVTESALGRKPAAMTFEQAAAIPHAAMLAIQGLIDVGKLGEGERVLINGAGGGVGTIGVQIAKRHGATVVGVDAAHKLGMLRGMGFDRVIDYRKHDFTLESDRYDLILDTKTTRSPSACLRALRPGGRYVTVGGDTGRLLQLASFGGALAKAQGKQAHIVALKPNKDLGYVREMFESVGLSTILDGPFPLDGVPEAIERFGRAEHLGKVVIKVA